MGPYWASAEGDVTLYLGDCLDVLAGMAAGSVDAVVTDPPYALPGGFMGKTWDRYDDGHEFQDWCRLWAAECLRVLKPGGWLLAFGGTRTWHRLVCGIEDAGFEVRDSVADLTGYDAPGLIWTYGSGFPKSLDVSKAIDKRRDDTTDVDKVRAWLDAERRRAGFTLGQINEHFGHASNGGGSASSWTTNPTSRALPTWEQWQQLRALIGFGDEMDAEVWRLNGRKGTPGEAWEQREVIGSGVAGLTAGTIANFRGSKTFDITAPATEDAARWEGWGTALKPGWEPIAVGRKPLASTVAGNVLAYGTGALNIDGCRVDSPVLDSERRTSLSGPGANNGVYNPDGWPARTPGERHNPDGRWPPNVVLGPAAAGELDRQSQGTRAAKPSKSGSTGNPWSGEIYGSGKNVPDDYVTISFADTGGASRFFPVFRYEAKAPASERPRSDDGTAHPTVKPVDLMRWLVRLVTPPGGTVADFFAGSGTTGEACIVEGFKCILAEKDPASAELIVKRLRKPIQPVMFGDVS